MNFGDKDWPEGWPTIWILGCASCHREERASPHTIWPTSEGGSRSRRCEFNLVDKADWVTRAVGFDEPDVVAISPAIETKRAAGLPISFDGSVVEECGVDHEAVLINNYHFEAIIKFGKAIVTINRDKISG